MLFVTPTAECHSNKRFAYDPVGGYFDRDMYSPYVYSNANAIAVPANIATAIQLQSNVVIPSALTRVAPAPMKYRGPVKKQWRRPHPRAFNTHATPATSRLGIHSQARGALHSRPTRNSAAGRPQTSHASFLWVKSRPVGQQTAAPLVLPVVSSTISSHLLSHGMPAAVFGYPLRSKCDVL
jgi:hypothetical protein